MLAIRLQRTGRKGYAQYRVVVQDSHRSPSSGRVVAYLGSYDPHAKTISLKKDQAQKFLDNGAQPSERVVSILKSEGIKLPKWVKTSDPKERTTRNPEKLRKNQPLEEKPAEEAAPEASEAPAEAEEVTEAPTEETTEAPAEDSPSEAEAADEVAEEKKD